MAHNLNEGRMFYVKEVPWHGIGTKLEKPATAAEAIAAARLDYKIESKSIHTEDGVLIDGKKATVRVDTQKPLGIVGDRYQIIQNVEAFSFFDVVVGEGQAIYHTAGALGSGERIWILAKLPENMMIAREDVVEKYLVLMNSHDGSTSLRMYFTPVRVVCQNTLTASLKDARDGISIRHIGDVKSKIDEARRALRIAVDYYAQFEQIAKQLVGVDMKVDMVEDYFDSLLFGDNPKAKESKILQNRKEDLLGLFEHGAGNDNVEVRHTMWAAYNAVTEYMDHHKNFRGEKSDPSVRLKNIWFGSSAYMKNKAYALALQKVGIKS